MAKQVLTEAGRFTTALNSIKNYLINDMGLSLIEANYITKFYSAVKDLNLFDSNYFKNFEYEGEVFDLKNVEKFVKFPESFYDIVLLVMHSKTFLANYNIDFDGINVKLAKKEIIPKEEKKDKLNKTLFDDYKVAEDENYYTFYIPNAAVAKKFRTFYGAMYPDDQDIKDLQNFFFPTWCIMSSSANSLFGSQKHEKNDIWLVTYLKTNPAKMLKEKFEVDSLLDVTSYLNQSVKNTLGEVYLMKKDGSLGNGRNYGYHVFSNSPGTGLEESVLRPNVSYTYGNLDVSQTVDTMVDAFVIEEGILKKCNLNKKVVVLPEGVTEIAEGAFLNLTDIEQVVLPVSTTTIKNKAFTNLRNLKLVNVKNTLEVIESNAFINVNAYDDMIQMYENDRATLRDSSFNNEFFAIGVLAKLKTNDGIDQYEIKKPSQLRYMPKSLLNTFKYYQSLNSGQTESANYLNHILKESFRVKRPTYINEELYSIEGNTLYLDADKKDAEKVTKLELPEGSEKIIGSLKLFKNLKEIVFPSTVKQLYDFEFPSDIKKIDLSKAKDLNIPVFTGLISLEEVLLSPANETTILPNAFSNTGVEQLYIPKKVSIALNAFKNAPFLETLIVDNDDYFLYYQDAEVLNQLEKLGIKFYNKEQ